MGSADRKFLVGGLCSARSQNMNLFRVFIDYHLTDRERKELVTGLEPLGRVGKELWVEPRT